MDHLGRYVAVLLGSVIVVASVATAAGAASPAPSPGVNAPRMLPDEQPTGIPGGTIETPLGKARWVHLAGDLDTLPDPLQPMIGPSGLIWLEPGGRHCGHISSSSCTRTVAPRLQTSTDVLSVRTEHPLPVAAETAALARDGDTYWLTTTGPASLWRSADLTTWEQIGTSSLVSPGPVELEWDTELGVPVSSRGISLVPVTYRARDPGALVGHPGQSVYLQQAAPGHYTVTESHLRSEGGDKDLGTVLIEETSTGLRFADETGTMITELAGAGIDLVDGWIANGSIQEQQLAVLDGGQLTATDTPGTSIADPTGGGTMVYPVESGFLAFRVDPDRTVHTWRSSDGRSWTEGDRVPGADGQPLHADWVSADSYWGDHEVSISPVQEPGADGPPRPWQSTDGEHWTAGAPPYTGEDGLRFDVPAGTLRLAEDGTWSASADGSTWVEVPELDRVVTKTTPGGNGPGSAGGGVMGNAVFFSVQEMEGTMQRDLWIIEFEPAAP